MHSSFVLFLFFVFTVPMTLAFPTNSTLHYLYKRDLVCGQDIRSLVKAENCLDKGVSFTQSGESVTKSTGVHKVSWDHIDCIPTLELTL